MPQVEAVVAVSDGGKQPKKLVRILGASDGSISIMVPWHPAKVGTVSKIQLEYGVTLPTGASFATTVERYRVEVPIKLSIHASGFVQFSQAGRDPIRSGETKPFSIPKGLGLHSQPITEPIETGPLFGASFDNASLCKNLDRVPRGVRRLLFEEGDFFERDEHDLESRHAYRVEGTLFPATERRHAHYDNGWVLDRPYSPLRPDWPARFRVLDLPSPLAFLGVLVNRWHTTTSSTGYSISSPRDRTLQFALVAWYPAVEDDDAESIAFSNSTDKPPVNGGQ